ncbi:MAG TPA: DUF4097 family beta strand repeat-containing protein [Pseudonocardiaceae bacterium]|jgi:DUF4097 and DUF4098 domain-containing protein YvlB|nr:DUF4097 family beta strand repeat-containing protein [Pseudonocardiaceae bacterium]
MPTFATPEPISVAIDLGVGDARITAGERTDTVVEVRPTDPSHDPDVRAAEQVRVEYAAGQLLVKAAKQRAVSLFSKPGSVDVTIDLPAGSDVRAAAGIAAFHGVGRLGAVRLKTGVGDIEFSHTGALDLRTGSGAIEIDRVAGNAEITTGSGRLRLHQIDGAAVIKNSNGDSWIGGVDGDLRISASNGDIAVDHAQAGVTANTANGDLRIGGVACGSSVLRTAHGQIEIGIQAGTAARLDVSTGFGRVRNDLDSTEDPGPADQTAEIHARTSFGDIVIRRAAVPEPN